MSYTDTLSGCRSESWILKGRSILMTSKLSFPKLGEPQVNANPEGNGKVSDGDDYLKLFPWERAFRQRQNSATLISICREAQLFLPRDNMSICATHQQTF